MWIIMRLSLPHGMVQIILVEKDTSLIMPVTLIGHIYVSSLTINPIVQQDNGTYIICTGIVRGGNEQQITASDYYILSINRKTLFSYFQALYIYMLSCFHLGVLNATVIDTMRQPNSLVIMWELLSTSTLFTFTISYENINNTQCFNDSNTILSSITAMIYTLRNLQEATEYSINVSVILILSGEKETEHLKTATLTAG